MHAMDPTAFALKLLHMIVDLRKNMFIILHIYISALKVFVDWLCYPICVFNLNIKSYHGWIQVKGSCIGQHLQNQWRIQGLAPLLFIGNSIIFMRKIDRKMANNILTHRLFYEDPRLTPLIFQSVWIHPCKMLYFHVKKIK